MISDRFDRAALPSPTKYFAEIGNPLRGRGSWRNALCPFHRDTKPSLRVKADTGAFRCMVCGARGGDVLAFHMQRTGKKFANAAGDLGAWT